MTSQADPGHFISQRELARRWGLSIDTLKRWRAQGRGPSWVRIGRQIRYAMRDIWDYESSRDEAPRSPTT